MAWPKAVQCLRFDSIDSTNLEAKRQAQQGQLGPMWISAREQTAGVGRRGRAWSSQEGNFSASLFFQTNEALQTLALRSFVAALALHDALCLHVDNANDLSLKWPNDVLFRGRKLAGILLESFEESGRFLTIGIGVNLARAPEPEKTSGAFTQPTHLSGLVTPDAFLEDLVSSYAAREEEFQRAGFPATKAEWMARAKGVGAPLVVRTPKEEFTGLFRTLDDGGSLVVEVEGQTRIITAADVFFKEWQ